MLPPSESLFSILNIDEQTDMQHIALHSDKVNITHQNTTRLLCNNIIMQEIAIIQYVIHLCNSHVHIQTQ